MKTAAQLFLKTGLILMLMASLNACGQKGPLEIDQPTTTPATQKEDPAQTR